jgi:hypothetical protein
MNYHWYLVSSLPVLRLGEKPTMSVDAFRAACTGHLSEDEQLAIEAVLENGETLLGAASTYWNREVQLRDAVVRVRAKNRGSDATPFLKPYVGFSVAIEKQVVDAFSRPNPLEQELALDRARWGQADELALTAPFGFPGILAFAIKVRIAERWAELDEETGKAKVEELILSATTEDIETGTES